MKLDPIYHEVIVSNNWIKNKAIFDNNNESPILYRGIGISIKSNSQLSYTILHGNPSIYSTLIDDNSAPPEKNIINSGLTTSLIATLQLRNNSRVTLIGSLDFLSDKFFTSSITWSKNNKYYNKSGNEEICKQISSWTFGERGILRIRDVQHYMIGDSTINPNRYRIKDEVEYNVKIEEYRLECNCWKPFQENDVQFEFIRLDPFIRQMMKHDNRGNYTIRFKIPDVFGIYKFTIDYMRYGWSYLHQEDLVTVRPYRHDEYERFLNIAYPYYCGSFSMIVGFVIFTIVFLFGTTNHKKVW